MLVLAYYVTGRLGLALPQIGTAVVLIWLPAGIALAALLRWGPGVWPGIVIGALGVALGTGAPPWAALGIAVGNAAGPMLAAALMQHLGFHNALDRRRDLLLFSGIGAAAAMLLTATNGVLWLALGGLLAPSAVPLAWLCWWLGDAVGALLVGVPLLTFSFDALRRRNGDWRWITGALLATGTLVTGAIAFAPERWAGTGLSPLVFVPHLLLCWLAVRSGIFAASTTALLLSAVAAFATATGHGPFAHGQTAHSLALLWGYVCTLSAAPLLVTALVGELTASDRRWQLAFDSSNIGISEWDRRSAQVILSRRWLTMLGHTTQTFGTSFDATWGRVHEEDQPGLRDTLSTLRPAKGARDNCSAQFRMMCSDGGWKWFEGHAIVAERAGNNEPLRILVTARDVGEQRAAEDRYQLSAKLFQHLHEGLLITDAAQRVLDVNPTFSAITGYSREEMLGTVPALMRPAPLGSAAERQQAVMRDSLPAKRARCK